MWELASLSSSDEPLPPLPPPGLHLQLLFPKCYSTAALTSPTAR